MERSLARDHRRCAGSDGQRAPGIQVARLRQAGGIERPVGIAVFDDPTVNAVTLPGGRIVLMRGLIDTVDDGAELAGVIAHEMGHIAHRDPTTLLLWRMGLGMVAATLGGAAEVAQDFLALSYSRRAGAAADAAAQQYLTRVGLRADGLGRFVARLETLDDHDGGIPWLATHPPTEQHSALATRSTAGMPPFSDAEWAALCAICH